MTDPERCASCGRPLRGRNPAEFEGVPWDQMPFPVQLHFLIQEWRRVDAGGAVCFLSADSETCLRPEGHAGECWPTWSLE